MRKVVLAGLFLFLGTIPLEVVARRWKPRFPNQRFRRGMVKAVRVLVKDSFFLVWKSPSGKPIQYRVVRPSKGMQILMKRAAKHNLLYAAVGTFRYRKGRSTAQLDHLYVFSKREQKMLAIKFDGWMPLYLATVFPTQKGYTLEQFEIRGNIQSHWKYRNNRLVCLRGVWFTLPKRRLGFVYQVQGIRGRSLFFFKKKYHKPHDWRHIENYDERRKVFLQYLRRKQKGLPTKLKPWKMPTMELARLSRYQKKCDALETPQERRVKLPTIVQKVTGNELATPPPPATRKVVPTTRPVVTSRPVARKAPASRPVAKTPQKAAPSSRPVVRKAPSTRPATPPASRPAR